MFNGYLKKPVSKRFGFTLIELLIVVAIIAILAAIAVPNFLEAQTRAKVSRTLADMRTMRTALESYVIDNNRYPETDQGVTAAAVPSPAKVSFLRLTTPISYLSSIPASPWKENYGTANPADPKLASKLKSYLYVRKKLLHTDANPDPNYAADRIAYIGNSNLINPLERPGIENGGEWLIKSVGPDNFDDRSTGPGRTGWSATNARVYDPTNGTVSYGDIVTFSDKSGTGKNQ